MHGQLAGASPLESLSMLTFSNTLLFSFQGTDPEPREGLSSGHMPHSISVPFQSVLAPESSTTPPYRTLLTPEELEKVFGDALGKEKWEKVKQGEKSVTATCGSGMTVRSSCVLSPADCPSADSTSHTLHHSFILILPALSTPSRSQAAVLWLALQRAGVTDKTAIYDEVRAGAR